MEAGRLTVFLLSCVLVCYAAEDAVTVQVRLLDFVYTANPDPCDIGQGTQRCDVQFELSYKWIVGNEEKSLEANIPEMRDHNEVLFGLVHDKTLGGPLKIGSLVRVDVDVQDNDLFLHDAIAEFNFKYTVAENGSHWTEETLVCQKPSYYSTMRVAFLAVMTEPVTQRPATQVSIATTSVPASTASVPVSTTSNSDSNAASVIVNPGFSSIWCVSFILLAIIKPL
ncbi:hypothetical protein BV898_02686 [Hypsibius exemplaris]|uniref:Uncharacterized protein n=1 Tax=Hypsibius exemplaris TaxID=2072580 RepID=A0A1W0X837_HYPEX|nr:hypothetical protein BV898_02686 [Hypsibius exemplaris]